MSFMSRQKNKTLYKIHKNIHKDTHRQPELLLYSSPHIIKALLRVFQIWINEKMVNILLLELNGVCLQYNAAQSTANRHQSHRSTCKYRENY